MSESGLGVQLSNVFAWWHVGVNVDCTVEEIKIKTLRVFTKTAFC